MNFIGTRKKVFASGSRIMLLLMLLLGLCGCGYAKTEAVPEEAPKLSGTVAYLGPEGTYTQEACEIVFGQQGTFTPFKTVNEAVQALSDGKTEYAVIPQENTIGGAVADYEDTLISFTDVSVVGEVELLIRQNLLGLPDASLDNVKQVYSHKQGLAQGKDWLEKNLPNAGVTEVSSTAEGARMVSEDQDPSHAAIASAGCAEVYGLKILAADIQNNDNNKTRFYVLSLAEPSAAETERLAFIASGPASELPKLMEELRKQGMTLVSLHDRPAKTELGQYRYLIECADSSYEDYKKLTGGSAFQFRYLGSFRVFR